MSYVDITFGDKASIVPDGIMHDTACAFVSMCAADDLSLRRSYAYAFFAMVVGMQCHMACM